MNCCMRIAVLLVYFGYVHSSFGSTQSIGPNGIDAAGLLDFNGALLNGSGSVIGQLEPQRPGKPFFDTDSALINSSVIPDDVFFRHVETFPPTPPDFTPTDNNSMEVDAHAVRVAGVMISTDTTDVDMDGDAPTGVAPSAGLFSAGYNPLTVFIDRDQAAAITGQHLAALAGTDIRAINMSFALPLTGANTRNGNQLFTQFVDWSARHHDVLYVVAGNELGETNSIPTDNFNGIDVASSVQVGGVYSQVADRNEYDRDADGDRTSIDLIAPGENIELADVNNQTTTGNATSYAAPHVVGTVALLQQYAEERIDNAGSPRWKGSPGAGQSAPAQRHEVMKAVLMNSADKLKDDGTFAPQGALLGMSRTVTDKVGNNWLASEAYDDDTSTGNGFIPLDDQMGAGHLNARRAVQQLAPGEYDANSEDVPTIGWDYGHTTGQNSINKYPLVGSLVANNFISITLAWDRHVAFSSDANMNGEYDLGDTFEPSMSSFPEPDSDDLINDLDIYLVPKGSFSINQAVALSASPEGTLEHIFFQIPTTDEYEIWVHQFDQEEFSAGQDYALAWWYGLAPPLVVQGDYNGDQIVDAQDYTAWRAAFGDSVTAGTGADGNGNGVIDSADYIVWRKSSIAGSGMSLPSVPEPSGLAFFACTIAVSICRWGDRVARKQGPL